MSCRSRVLIQSQHRKSLPLIRNVFAVCSRVFASLVAGLATGVLGVTGWGGFAYYFLAHALVCTATFRFFGSNTELH